MRKAMVWVGLAGAVGLALVAALALVRAPFDPARMIKHKFFSQKEFEAQIQFPLVHEMSADDMEKWLKNENEILHSEEVLAPLVKELGLVAEWKLPGEKEALATLRKRCELRRGELPMIVVLAVRDKKSDLAGRLSEAVRKAYMARHRPLDEGFHGGF